MSFWLKKSVLFFFFLSAISLFAEEITYSDTWGKPGFSLLESTSNEVQVNFSIDRFGLVDRLINGETMKYIELKGRLLPNDAGMPDLPRLSRYIALPQGADVSLKVLDWRTETIHNVEMAPAPQIPFDTQDGPAVYEKDQTVYSENAFYPENPVLISSKRKIRGVDVTLLGITPFQYNPVTKDLLIYRDIKVQLTFSGGNGHFGEDRLRNRFWEPMMSDLLMNYRSLPKIKFKDFIPKANSKTDATQAVENVEYLIIVPDDPDFIAWADSLKLFRNQQGISTGVVTITEVGGNTVSAIETYVDNAYNNWDIPPSAILLMADYGNSGNTITSKEEPHPYSGTYISDNWYADVDGDDLPDIIFSRMTAQNATHLEQMVGKILDYERNPPTSADFYDHPVTAMGWQTSRWFQLCSEIINGFWEHGLGKAPVRENKLYSGGPEDGWSTATNTETIVDYFGPDGLGYIPETPDHLTDFGGNATRINNDINSGAFMLQHRDHGGEDGWSEPSYKIGDLSGLHNTELTFVFSINCLTGEFNYSSECFVEAFHRDSQRALGLIGATQVSYSFVNDTYTWGMYDNMWPQFMPDEVTHFATRFILPAFGNAAGKYFLQGSDWPSNPDDKQITYYLFHHHGGSYSMVYSEIPQNLTVTHDSEIPSASTSFTVTADDGSLIGLSVDGEIIGTADGTGSPVTIDIAPQDPGKVILVTVTKQNYFRYSSEVQVVAADGPHITVDSYNVNDTYTGNGNNQADFNEAIQLDVDAKNIGNEAASGVSATLSTTDTYLTITDNYNYYGDMAVNQVVTGDTVFSVTVADGTPDQHGATCSVEFTDAASKHWTSDISFTVNAPDLVAGSLQIDDSATGNNDGDLDEGETAQFIIPTINQGHAAASATSATLTSQSAYLTIQNSPQTLGTIAADDTLNANFTVTADAATPNGTHAHLYYSATSGSYSIKDTFEIIIGEKVTYLMDNKTVTVNNGLFYDTGGPNANYSTKEDITMTFMPDGSSPAVKVHFTSFNTIADHDYLSVYDGTSTSAPEVAGSPFSGTSLPPDILASNDDGALTFRFRSNPAFTSDGWAADIYSTTVAGTRDYQPVVVKEFALKANYPNPFNPTTEIRYQIARTTHVQLSVYNMLGQKIATLVNGKQKTGVYSVRFDAANLAAGIYFYRLSTSSGFTDVGKMILLK